MNKLAKLFLLALNMGLCVAVHAEKADTGKPVNFEAEQMAVDDVKQVRTLSGNVIVTRGSMILKADKMILTVTPEGYQSAVLFADPGKLATFRQKRDGGDIWDEVLGEGKVLRCALNHQMVTSSTELVDGAEVAFFPPVTGG